MFINANNNNYYYTNNYIGIDYGAGTSTPPSSDGLWVMAVCGILTG